MDLGKLDIFKMASQKMGWLTERQVVLANNIANADTPNYILRAISMFFREKEDLGKTLLNNPNCPLGVLYDVIRGDNDELKETATKSPVVKKLKPAGFGRYANPDTGEVIAKMQDGKLVPVEK